MAGIKEQTKVLTARKQLFRLPRFLIALAIAILSFATVPQHLARIKSSAIEYYDTIRFVYQLEHRLENPHQRHGSEPKEECRREKQDVPSCLLSAWVHVSNK